MPITYFKTITFLLIFLGCSSSNEQTKNEEQDLTSLYPPQTIVIETHTEWTSTHYPKRIKEFMANPLEVNDIVFLGNSITEQGGDWANRFNNSIVKNRGIAGDTTDGVLARLDELIYYKPNKVFMLIGINDLFREDMSSQKVYDNIIKIVRRINLESPATKIFLQTVLPTSTENLKIKIQETNQKLENSESSKPYTLISLHDQFNTENDLMNMEYSTDGVHLNEEGYSNWVATIKDQVNL